MTIPITPNYNVSSPDKAQHVRQNPALNKQVQCWENQHFRDRWRTLLSVDDLVDAVYTKLEAENLLNNTFIFYSSDHGYKQGQWRVGTSKQHPYETDIRVPLLVRGPGVPVDTKKQVSGNVDLMPTLLDLAAGENYVQAADLDGKSMAGFLVKSNGHKAAPAWRDAFLNEYLSVGTYYNDHSSCWQDGKETTNKCGGKMPRGPDAKKTKTCKESEGVGDGNCYFVDSKHSNNWRQLRIVNASMNWNYVEYDPEWKFNGTGPTGSGLQHYELYDIESDPYQVKNIYATTSEATKAALHSQLKAYWACRGKECP